MLAPPQPSTTMLVWDSVPSPMGECTIVASDEGLFWVGTPGASLVNGIAWAKKHGCSEHVTRSTTHPVLRQAKDELRRYFAGEHVTFSTPLAMQGTPFQLAVWHELCTIPYGETRSYGEQALAIGRPKASRAVGAANGANPSLSLFPVTASSGAMVHSRATAVVFPPNCGSCNWRTRYPRTTNRGRQDHTVLPTPVSSVIFICDNCRPVW